MSYKRTKTGPNTYSTYNNRTGVSTYSTSYGPKGNKTTYSDRSDGKSYTTRSYTIGGWTTKERKSNVSIPKPKKIKSYNVSTKTPSFKIPKTKTTRSKKTYVRSRPLTKTEIKFYVFGIIMLFLFYCVGLIK
jgi:hypothetical protein